ncbi:hypothetical protein MtrunA17_Chr8g0340241 [Medicago truncatula]|uniref:RALF-like protein n=1 Tax=Medicago truncatula TaxID=3880 RepID=G7LFW5_MEDTR|nr:RALF-like protein [Medicago truncatula]RHN39102.1 hypothetical protein MtrunA17_Chr8g0340241 [Medicago truncatula]
MAKIINFSFVLVLLISVTIMNGYNVEGGGRGSYQMEKDDSIYNSQKTIPNPIIDCVILFKLCYFVSPTFCAQYYKMCTIPNPPPTSAQSLP